MELVGRSVQCWEIMQYIQDACSLRRGWVAVQATWMFLCCRWYQYHAGQPIRHVHQSVTAVSPNWVVGLGLGYGGRLVRYWQAGSNTEKLGHQNTQGA